MHKGAAGGVGGSRGKAALQRSAFSGSNLRIGQVARPVAGPSRGTAQLVQAVAEISAAEARGAACARS